MENEQPFSEQDSLRVIHEMITAAKSDVKGDSFIFLLWGYLVFIASISQFILVRMNIDHNDVPWLLMPLGGIVTAVYYMRRKKNEKAKTHVSEFLKFVWIAFGVAMCVIMFSASFKGNQMLPTIMTLYGIGLFVTGGALKFKPLIIGGIFCWVCAIAGFHVEVIYQLLIIAAAVLGGYIIPGHLIQLNNKNQNV
ncbi:MAG: hypothetical protein ACXVPU_07950 [Bacteroidia bacterium]